MRVAPRAPQMPAHGFETFAEFAVAVEIGDARVLECRTGLAHADEHAGESHLRQAAGAIERDQDDLVSFAVPVLLGPSPQVTAADQARLVIVGPVIGRARMRNLDRDQRNVRLAVLGGDNRRHVLVGLKLDHEVDLLAHQHVGVALRDLRVVAVVDADQLDALPRPRPAAGRSRPPSRTDSRCPAPRSRADTACA